MKILKIFGVVVAVHAAVFMFVFAIPGCRTTQRSTPPAPPADTTSAPASVTYPGAGNINPVAVAPGDASSSLNGADLNPGTSTGSPSVSFNAGPASSAQHFNPTRPGTPVAGALESAEVTGVTPATTYKVVSNDSLWKVAKKHSIGVDDLAKANNLRPGSPLKVGQKLIIPGKAAAPSSATGAAGTTNSTRTYTVKAGDTIGSIAHKQAITTAAIRSLNPQLKSDTLRAGQDLTLPASAAAAPAASSVPTPTVAATKTAATASGSVEYTVKPGEGLSQIAKKYGVPMREIASLNNIADPKSLRAGQKIMIPGVKTPTPAPATIPSVEQAPVSPVSPSDSPVAPSPSVDSNPVSAPAASDVPPPPVVKVDESAPIAPANN